MKPTPTIGHYASHKSEIISKPGAVLEVRTIGLPKRGGWIPVSERLPEKDCECIVFIEPWKSIEIQTFRTVEDESYFINVDFGEKLNVKFWQPLPEPPK